MTEPPLRSKCPVRRLLLLMVTTLATIGGASAGDSVLHDGFSGLSLEDLLKREVTSVSRRPEELADAAAAVHVISREQILRAGVRTVAEALRLAPGVQVNRLSANRWSISIRGGADRFANKLLLLVDGRNAYTPAFSGVYWEAQLVPLADIEQIEVIRGPGAVAWGLNAVNGVINIITRSAVATTGTRMNVGGGTREGAFATVSSGRQRDDDSTYYRYHAHVQRGVALKLDNGLSANDAHTSLSIGTRWDGYLAGGGRWGVSADWTRIRTDDDSIVPAPPPVFLRQLSDEQRLDSASLRLRYSDSLDSGADVEAQFAVAQTDTQIPALGRDERVTVDVDLQFRPPGIGRHQLNLGLSGRVSDDTLSNGAQQTTLNLHETFMIWSAFLEDQVALTDDFSLIVGARLDHHDFTGSELQPTVRFLWNVGASQTVWGSVSRAARTPSRGERSFDLLAAFAPNGAPIRVLGNRNFGTEELRAAELGYRAQWGPRLFGDFTLFHHRYEDLRTVEPVNPITLTLANGGALDVSGFEATGSLRFGPRVSLSTNYAYTEAESRQQQTAEASAIPRHIATAVLAWTVHPKLSADLMAYHVSRHSSFSALTPQEVEPFTALNLALGYSPNRNTTVRLVGQDLLKTRTVEAIASTPVRRPIAVPRAFYLDLSRVF